MAKVEKGIVFTSNSVIDYAEGGVVSKELVHSNAGSVLCSVSMLAKDFQSIPHHSMLSFRLLMEKWN